MRVINAIQRKWNLQHKIALGGARAVGLISALAFVLCLLFPGPLSAQTGDIEEKDPLDVLRDAVVDTGVGRDFIPALFNPRYISVSDASLSMEDNEVVFVATFFPDGTS